MDDGGDVEAQPGPISSNYERPDPEPWTWIGTALLYLIFALSAGMLAGGVVVITVGGRSGSGADGVPAVSDTAIIFAGSIVIVGGFVTTALGVFLVKTHFRIGREINAMTRRHMVPVSPG
jgi:UPF0716 family protein affecting phage T7 exclusion